MALADGLHVAGSHRHGRRRSGRKTVGARVFGTLQRGNEKELLARAARARERGRKRVRRGMSHSSVVHGLYAGSTESVRTIKKHFPSF